MTSSSCHPKAHQYSRNPFNDEGDPIGEAIGQMLKGKEGGVNIEERNFNVVKARELAREAGIVSNMSYENLEAYWIKNGMASVDKEGRLVGKDFGYKIGLAAATTDTYLQQRGGAVRDLAGEFLRKVNGGVDATAEGMALAREMQGVGRVAEVMLGWKQKTGRGEKHKTLHCSLDGVWQRCTRRVPETKLKQKLDLKGIGQRVCV